MSNLIFLLTFMGSLPGVEMKQQVAANEARRAVMESPQMKQEADDLGKWGERQMYSATGKRPQDLAIALYAYPIISKQVSTKLFQNLSIDMGNQFYVRPEITMSWDGQTEPFHAVLTLSKAF